MKRKLLVLVSAIFLFMASAPVNVFSMSAEQKRIFDSGIPYYNVDDGSGCSGGGSALPEETIAMMESYDIKGKAESNMAAYEAGARDANIPWQALAAIHWREASMDPARSLADGESLGVGISIDGQQIGNTLSEDAKITANNLVGIGKEVYGVNISLPSASWEDFAWAFLAYNRGFMYQSVNEPFDHSPYVMNYYDKNHWDMRWIHADSWYAGRQINSVEGLVNSQLGALTVFAYLGGMNQTSSACDGYAGSNPVVDINGVKYTFPLLGATKKNVMQGQCGASDLSAPPGWSHHDYPAADLGLCGSMLGLPTPDMSSGFDGPGKAMNMYASTGVKVVAVTDGKISSYTQYTNKIDPAWHSKCSSVSFDGNDGNRYWLGHMAYDNTKKAGDEFKVGDVIGVVGDPKCAQDTQAHLHIQYQPSRDISGLIQRLYESLKEE